MADKRWCAGCGADLEPEQHEDGHCEECQRRCVEQWLEALGLKGEESEQE